MLPGRARGFRQGLKTVFVGMNIDVSSEEELR
jgi:hypothetical protein